MRLQFDPARIGAMLLGTFALASAISPADAVTLNKIGACTWEAREPGAAYDRFSIEQGDHLMISLHDSVFESWGNSAGNTIELSANHAPKRVRIRDAWTDVVPGQAILGAYLYAEARRVLGGAKSMQLWKQGKMLVDLPLVNTPSTKQLNACVPHNRHDDEAEER
jgi:hypothetical protein